MKSYKVHYMNKYPGGQVQMSDSAIDVYDANGEHVVSLSKNGAGMWVDRSEEMGCSDRHDLSPIPKDARCFKLYKDGKIGKAEEFEARMKSKDDFLCDKGMKIQSCEEIGLSKFDEKQRLLK